MKTFLSSSRFPAAFILLLVFSTKIFPFAIGYSGIQFATRVSGILFFQAGIILIFISACFIFMRAFIENKQFAFIEKYCTSFILPLFGIIFLILLFSNGLSILNSGFYVCLFCAVIIKWNMLADSFLQKLKIKTT